jgi:YbbR domain-containing protein
MAEKTYRENQEMKILTNNWGLKLLALVLATVIYFVIRAALENPAPTTLIMERTSHGAPKK